MLWAMLHTPASGSSWETLGIKHLEVAQARCGSSVHECQVRAQSRVGRRTPAQDGYSQVFSYENPCSKGISPLVMFTGG